MNILDDINYIKKIDVSEGYKSLELLPDQIRQVLIDSSVIKIPKEYSKVNNIVVAGMGGSNLGARIAKALFATELKVPLDILAGYEVPAYVNEKTLFVLSSYSGTTEEVLSLYLEVKKRGAKIIGITSRSGKKLEKMMMKEDILGYIFDPKFNPANSPRLAVGYAVFGLAVLLAKAGMLELKTAVIEKIVNILEVNDRELRPEADSDFNLAKQIAVQVKGKIPVIVGAEFLEANVFVMRNQFCETAKNFANYLVLPDLNHFAMEGLVYPENNQHNLVFLFFDSELYTKRIQKRALLTKQVIEKNSIKVISHKLQGKSKLGQSMEMLQFASYVTYYLAILNEQDPIPNPWVDWFKENLG
ncbi:SIS domain-containing protein [Patescibacteria group bacterium]|nr:SIS domain-containing protein [Patescibacteria group bacterium]